MTWFSRRSSKISTGCFFFALISLPAWQVCAQSKLLPEARDSGQTAAEAAQILGQPGGSEFDPEEILEYLDDPPTSGSGIQAIHNEPDMTWPKALRRQRANAKYSIPQSASDSVMHCSLRSRAESSIAPESEQGFQSGVYLGSPDDFYTRAGIRTSAVNAALMQRKKAWEPKFTDRLGGFAELRQAIPISNSIRVERLVAGDYALAFGTGLLFGGGASGSRSSAAASSAEPRAFGVRGTLGTDPSHALRGAAAQFAIGSPGSMTTRLLLFGSNRQIDSRVSSDTIQTIYTSTNHRTIDELALKNTSSLQLSGIRASVSTTDTEAFYISAGLTAFDARYDHPYNGTPSIPFVGRAVDALGSDILAVAKTWSSHIEAALTANDTSKALLLSASGILQPSTTTAISVLYYHLPYGSVSPFGEISGTSTLALSNADVLYTGIEFAIIPGLLRVSSYAEISSALLPVSDIFGRRRSDYQCAAYLRLPTSRFDAAFIVRRVNRSAVSSTVLDSDLSRLATSSGSATNIRFEAAYAATAAITLTARYEHVGVVSPVASGNSTHAESGWLGRAEVVMHSLSGKFKLALSAARFGTDSYASALYIYETRTPGTGGVLLLDGRGYRISGRSTLTTWRSIDISVEAGETLYDGVRILGSGLASYAGRSSGDITCQLDLAF
ncbi:MAG: hypothetical protein Q8922_02520 [Bacteroidota bacterium]|nr:hypothetical protein [Bacteroidota bacterium]MDP4232250.1 hypothetical protein [Bacteroidota bacterium]MDP4242652.1 hypothetical protein [Bacteroidota bacterium]MDP4286786.1 hypothetical protein [Bacteroidota bacterium]